MTTKRAIKILICLAALATQGAFGQAKDEVCVQSANNPNSVECHKLGSSTGAAVANAANIATAQIAAQATGQIVTNLIQDHKAHKELTKNDTPEQKAAIKACQAEQKKAHHFSRLDTMRYGNFEVSCRQKILGGAQ